MITILLQKILAALTTYFTAIKTKLELIKENLEDMLVTVTATGDIVSFNSSIKYPLEALTVDLVEGETATVYHRGANLWDEQWEIGAYNDTTGLKAADDIRIRSKNYISVKTGETYYFAEPQSLRVYQYDKDKTYLGYTDIAINGSRLYTPAADCCYINFRMGSTTNPVTTYSNNISINYPATDTTYHAYDPSSANYDYPLTASDIVTMKGKNTFWSDNGPITVEYLSKSQGG